ncbi:GTP-binding protein [Streptomyces sp. enrichment culture]|uniref:GTP-binding protein n=1 Tax=Streptomyces sp. enrichment culture TaxID=1795815 RepID=UPI003F56E0ED
MGTPTFKIVVIGNGGVGKSTFVEQAAAGAEGTYVTKLGAMVTPVHLSTNMGDFVFNCWDTAGQEKFGGLRDGFYVQTMGVIYMFDMTSLASYQALPKWHEDVERNTENVPAVVIGNKADTQDRAVPADELTFHLDHDLPYYELSARDDTNLGEPFLSLAQKLIGRSDLALAP